MKDILKWIGIGIGFTFAEWLIKKNLFSKKYYNVIIDVEPYSDAEQELMNRMKGKAKNLYVQSGEIFGMPNNRYIFDIADKDYQYITSIEGAIIHF